MLKEMYPDSFKKVWAQMSYLSFQERRKFFDECETAMGARKDVELQLSKNALLDTMNAPFQTALPPPIPTLSGELEIGEFEVFNQAGAFDMIDGDAPEERSSSGDFQIF